MFYIEINNGLITGKGEGEFKTNEQIEVSEEIYNALTNLPAEFTESNGVITNVTPFPLPEPTPAERREREYETDPLIEWQGQDITVGEANVIYLRYLAEGSQKAEEIQALIATAKESIRQMYPDEVE